MAIQRHWVVLDLIEYDCRRIRNYGKLLSIYTCNPSMHHDKLKRLLEVNIVQIYPS